ncbi:hypothetical protein LAT59_00585 [Candidatus Gracilibacteria bacterium]|nr:hypothetical protein [Candidatus Gracilibacteria bacterium]
MGVEGGNLCTIDPYNISPDGINIPRSLRESIVSETQNELLDCFIDNLHIQHDNSDFIHYIKNQLKALLQNEGRYYNSLDSEFLRDRIYETLFSLYESEDISENKTFYEIFFNNNQQYIVIGGISLNFGNIISENFKISHEDYIRAYKLGIIERQVVWDFLEGEDGFLPNLNNGYTLGMAIEELGFHSDVIDSVYILFGRELTDDEWNNLALMIGVTLQLETSGGWNIRHNTGASTADGYFQYLTGNGRLVDEIRILGRGDNEPWNNAITHDCPEGSECIRRSRWHTNSYETALRSIGRYEDILATFPVFRDEIGKIEIDTEAQVVSNLSANEQIILFLADMTRNGRVQQILNFLEYPTKENFLIIYQLHHSDISQSDTLQIINERVPKYFNNN